ncbi:hypothetical protein K443DRAFT_683720 [Laccaria amethystina LaAM-08-1]|uniref:Protein kinase domain-containing protein n=1 Tax=Laccaria amethystina LaAM-08-1 TaxID=1095629 RepID=A0A0C9WJD1_9AGAR|nr:hypothetical protein K443DRAFT_683720 [Laccaria amethystina LaAM-08-1]
MSIQFVLPLSDKARSSSYSSESPTPPLPVPLSSEYFGDALYESPNHSDDESVSEPDGDEGKSDTDKSDSTLEEEHIACQIGHPLQRMQRCGSLDCEIAGCTENDLVILTKGAASSSYSSRTHSTSSVTSARFLAEFVDYDKIVEFLLQSKVNPFQHAGPRNLVVYDPLENPAPISNGSLAQRLLIKCLPRSSKELLVLLEINHPELRQDPWNAAPHILCAVERDEDVYLCMDPLVEFDQPPMRTVANYIDFFRQILEGLTFLHEHRIAGLSCAEPSSYMVDLSSGRTTTSPSTPASELHENPVVYFDRTAFPVRYYFVNFTNAQRVSSRKDSSSSPASPADENSLFSSPFKKDVQECGTMIDNMLINVPQIAPKMKSLIKAMTLGGFSADDARKLFEALCRTLDARVFEQMPGSKNPPPGLPPRAQTVSFLPAPQVEKRRLEKYASR